MIKVEQLPNKDGSVDLIFESREKDGDALETLDNLYTLLMGIRSPDIAEGGFLNSFSFKLKVRDARSQG